MSDEKKALSLDELEMVTGGNYGDTKKEKDNNEPLYKIGDIVEVFLTAAHLSTKRGTIVRSYQAGGFLKSARWRYAIRFEDGTEEDDIPADSIDRNNCPTTAPKLEKI